MSEDVAYYIAIIREMMVTMKDEDRVRVKEELMDGYCDNCGGLILQSYCHCENNE